MSLVLFERLLDEELSLDEQVQLLESLPALDIDGMTLAAYARAVLARAVSVPFNNPQLVDLVGTGGDRSLNFNISTTASFIAAGAGVLMAKHGSRAITSHSGAFDLLQALNISIPETAEAALAQFNQHHLTFLFAPYFHPSFKKLAAARAVFATRGVRTIFNFLGPLVNPGRVKRAAIGVFDVRLVEPFMTALRELQFEKALVMHGAGTDELSLAGVNHVAYLEKGSLRLETFNASDLGLTSCARDDLQGGEASENARIALAILSGADTGPKCESVLLNAAAAIYVSKEDMQWSLALDSARDALTSGRAYKVLQALQQGKTNAR